jgi:hypothetical protein
LVLLSAEGAREFQPRATPWVAAGGFIRTLKEFAKSAGKSGFLANTFGISKQFRPLTQGVALG